MPRLFQYQQLTEPVSESAEVIFLDKWEPHVSEPYPAVRYPVAVGITITDANSLTQHETITLDKWEPRVTQPYLRPRYPVAEGVTITDPTTPPPLPLGFWPTPQGVPAGRPSRAYLEPCMASFQTFAIATPTGFYPEVDPVPARRPSQLHSFQSFFGPNKDFPPAPNFQLIAPNQHPGDLKRLQYTYPSFFANAQLFVNNPNPSTNDPCAMTVAKLERRVWDSLDDDGTYFTEPEVLHALNVAQRLFCFLTLCIERTATFALTNGQYFYSVSSQISDFLCPLRVSWIDPITAAKTRLKSDTLHQMDLGDDTWRSRPGNPVRYAQEGFDTFWVTPQPASGVNALQFVYAAEPAVLVTQDDIPEIPTEQHVHLPDIAYFILHLKIGGAEMKDAVQYLKRGLDAIKKYQSFVRAKTRAQLYDKVPYDLSSFDMSRFDFKLARPKSKPPTQSQLKQESKIAS